MEKHGIKVTNQQHFSKAKRVLVWCGGALIGFVEEEGHPSDDQKHTQIFRHGIFFPQDCDTQNHNCGEAKKHNGKTPSNHRCTCATNCTYYSQNQYDIFYIPDCSITSDKDAFILPGIGLQDFPNTYKKRSTLVSAVVREEKRDMRVK